MSLIRSSFRNRLVCLLLLWGTTLLATERYIITGGPGVGKTTILNSLKKFGYGVVAEAATDLINEGLAKQVPAPWNVPGFSVKIALLQEERQKASHELDAEVIFFDRSPIDVFAYDFLLRGSSAPSTTRIVQDLLDNHFYNRTVFFIESLGYCEETTVRKDSLEKSLKIERALEKTYRALGFKLVRIPAAPIEERVQKILKAL